LVPVLGSRGVLPVEVVPYGLSFCRRRLEAMGYPCEPRRVQGELFRSDNGNPILDCRVSAMLLPEEVDKAIGSTPGVVATGLFLAIATMVLVQEDDKLEVRHRHQD
jgi:ribose 5-phosphate isomerase A